MATKKVKKNSNKTTVEALKTKAQNINEVALKTSNEIVEETLATGEQWQKIFAKALKKGTVLFGKQQELTLNGIEMLKGQFEYGTKRAKQLFSMPKAKSAKKKTAAKKSAPKAKADKGIDELMEATIKAEKATKKAVKTVAKKTAKVVKKATKPAAAKAAPAIKKASKPAPAKAAKKPVAATNKTAQPSATAKSTKLTVIEGIGPKIQEVLNKAGIANLDKLAEANPADLKDILLNAGTRYQMHDPSTWPAQAKLAAAGKMEELKVLQGELKGGK